MIPGRALLVLAAIPGVLGAAVGGAGAANVTLSPCGAFEEHLACGSSCPRTCTNPNPVCDDECVEDVCQCIEGYARDLIDGSCVPVETCGRSPEDDCRPRCRAQGGILPCADGSKCVSSCSTGSLAFLQNARRTEYCAGDNNEYLSCVDNKCEKNDVCTGPNEIYRDCGDCEARCDNRKCDTRCPQTCVCKPGFSRSAEGLCVAKCCPAIGCEAPQECAPNTIKLEFPQEIDEDGCVIACASVTCVPIPVDIEDGAKCEAPTKTTQASFDQLPMQMMQDPFGQGPAELMQDPFNEVTAQVPSAEQPQCRTPSTCLEDAGVCGRDGERILWGTCIGRSFHTTSARECDRKCDGVSACVAWEYKDNGALYLGTCRLFSSYHRSHPYYNLRPWGFGFITDQYVSAIKR